MTFPRKSVYEWAVEFAGDPNSFDSRHQMILTFLAELGMKGGARVLELGPGPLGLGRHLANRVDYVGIQPSGWEVEAALDRYPDLASVTKFLWRDDFLPAGEEPFDVMVAHSVLSHMAFWQMEQCLANLRKYIQPDGYFLASIRLSDVTSYDEEWQYPGISTFRIQTLQVLGHHFGWTVEHRGDLKTRLTAVAPNDVHDWVVFRPTMTAAEVNDMRLSEEFQRDQQKAKRAEERERYVVEQQARWPETK